MIKSSTILITAATLLELPKDGLRHELIRGELTSMTPSGSEHGETTIWIGRILANYIAEHHLGRSFGAEAGFLVEKAPDTVLAPDFAFVSKTRVEKRLPKGFFPGAPDLAVEVLSPNDRVVEVDDKIQRWLDAGCRQVWIVNMNRRTLTIHQSKRQPQVLVSTDWVDGADLLPGFRATVDELLPPIQEA